MFSNDGNVSKRNDSVSVPQTAVDYHRFCNLAPDILYLFDLTEKKCIYHNDGFETALGYDNSHECLAVDDPVGYMMHIEDFSTYSTETFVKYRTLPDATPLHRIIRLKHNNGEWHSFECSDRIYERDKNGNPVSVLSFLHDVTSGCRSQEDLSHQKEYLSTILHSIDEGVITTDKEGIIQSMNAAAETLTGWTFQDAREHRLTDVFTVVRKSVRPVEYGFPSPTSPRNQLTRKQTVLISRDGTEFIIDEHVSPIKNHDNSISGSVIIFRDVTDRYKFIEATLNNQKLDALGVLAGGIAHDFNNLLGGIYGYIDLAMLSNEALDHNGYMSKAIVTIDRARDLTRQLLTFAKGGAPIRKSVDLFPGLKNSILTFVNGSRHTCHFSVSPDLWMCSVDIHLIEQAVNNIILNAMDAMADGGPISVTASNSTVTDTSVLPLSPGRYIHIEIADRGNGIPEDIIPYIFDPFFTTKSKGHGLGLASCHSIIYRHDGCIDITTDMDTGTVFHVYLPAVFETVRKTRTPLHSKKMSGTILLMDDEEIIRDITSKMLESLGFSVISTCEKHETIEQFKKGYRNDSFSAVILDLTINGKMEGKDVADAIRKLDLEVPVFVSSGYAEDPVIAYPERYGFTGSIKKPFRITELKRVLYDYCR